MKAEPQVPTLPVLDSFAEVLRTEYERAKSYGMHIQKGIHGVPLPLLEQMAMTEGQKLHVFWADGFCSTTVGGVTFYSRELPSADRMRERVYEIIGLADQDGGWSDPALHEEYDAILARLGIDPKSEEAEWLWSSTP